MTTPVLESSPPFARARSEVPPLENGDSLTRDEFERRFDATPGLKKAELIEGVVYMAPPALRWDYHARPDMLLGTWLGVYESATPGVQAGHNASIRLDLNNEPQPDLAMIIQPGYGGQVRISPDNYVEGAPELVVEISSSSASIDLNSKFGAYQRNGVREYLVWRVHDCEINWFALRDAEFVPLSADGQGVIRSAVFPGLWLDTISAVRLDASGILRHLQAGLATAEHKEFVSALQARQKSPSLS